MNSCGVRSFALVVVVVLEEEEVSLSQLSTPKGGGAKAYEGNERVRELLEPPGRTASSELGGSAGEAGVAGEIGVKFAAPVFSGACALLMLAGKAAQADV